jgi:hypothetical protein
MDFSNRGCFYSERMPKSKIKKGKSAMRFYMRRFLVLFLIFLTHYTWGNDLFRPLNSGEPIETGQINSAVMMRNAEGTLYFIYEQNGSLMAKRSLDGGTSFASYSIDFSNHNFTNVRQLSLFCRIFQYPLSLFVADENGDSALYALSLDKNGELALFSSNRLDDLAAGTITSYDVHPDSRNKLLIFYLKSSTLKYSSISIDNGVALISNVQISNSLENVDEYGFYEQPGHFQSVIVGYYKTIDPSGSSRVYALTVMESRVSNIELVATSAYSSNPRVLFIQFLLQTNPMIVFVDGQYLSIFENTAGSWQRKAIANVPFTQFQYIPITDWHEIIDAIATPAPNGDCYINITDSNAFENSVNTDPIIKGPIIIPCAGQGKALFIYLKAASNDGSKSISINRYNFTNTEWNNIDFPINANTNIVDAWLGGPVLAELEMEGGAEYFTVFVCDQTTGVFQQVIRVPLDAISDTIDGHFLSGNILELDFRTQKAFIDMRSWGSQIEAGTVSYINVPAMDIQRYFLTTNGQGMVFLLAGNQ